jgi:hypothetical protein
MPTVIYKSLLSNDDRRLNSSSTTSKTSSCGRGGGGVGPKLFGRKLKIRSLFTSKKNKIKTKKHQVRS